MNIITKPCAGCGQDFSVSTALNGKHRKYCSHECYSTANIGRGSKPKAEKTCPECGTVFYVKPSSASRRTYCSRPCKDKNPTIQEKAARKIRVLPDKTCTVCGTMFRPSQGRVNCCSVTCAHSKSRKRDFTEQATRCEICSTPLTGRQISCGNKFCSRKCLGIANARWHADPENKEFMRQHGTKTYLQNQNKPTTIEVAMTNALDAAAIPYTYQFPVGNLYGVVFVCDFLINNSAVVIECDGDYWHNLPDVIAKDERKDKYLKACGYTVLHFTETQIKQDVNTCVQSILKYL